MSITVQKSNQLRSIAILMMLFLHLFNRDYKGLFQPLVFIGNQPLFYYLSLFCDACVPIFAFVSGYGLYFKFRQDKPRYASANSTRLKKFYLNFWIIVILFAVILGFVLGTEGYPGSWQKLLLTATAIDPSYNGAWWFLTTYIFFVLTSTFWFKLLERFNPYMFVLALFIMYVVAFYFRILRPVIFESGATDWFHRQSVLYFCTLLQFMLGAFALKFDWSQKISNHFATIKFKNSIVLLAIVFLIAFRSIVPNLIFAPFTGLGFIFLFLQLDLPAFLSKIINYFIPHATNIWLVHMFFYMIYFREFIYSPQYVIPIFTLLVLVSVLASYLIKLLEKPLSGLLFSPRPQTKPQPQP
ncbi:acyltransferase [Chryseobacterium sp. cx-311]|uniref:acyltransferase family protein n=1 Tax=Marnyiella aurantia TaxID=2758037 RepID=UPI001AE2B217|nr:acyltransferase [Marnyiella aurantia]MBP0612946.1 acyltransferase [Marnyiella aurantia]